MAKDSKAVSDGPSMGRPIFFSNVDLEIIKVQELKSNGGGDACSMYMSLMREKNMNFLIK